MLHGDSRSKRDGNRYWTWIENYVADDYVEAVKIGSGKPFDPCLPQKYHFNEVMVLELLERQAVQQSPSRIEELVKIFIHATKVSSGARPG